MKNFLVELWGSTIWAEGAIPDSDYKIRSLKRFWLPIYDLALIWMGYAAIRNGIPAFELLLPEFLAKSLGWLVILIAIGCVIGVAFPRLSQLELWSKSALIGVLCGYFAALRILIGVEDDGNRDAISIVVLLAAILPLYRLTILGDESRERKEQKKLLRTLLEK